MKKKLGKDGKEERKKISIVGDITVFQPTSDQFDFLMDFLEKHINKETKKIEIDGEDVYKVLFKELTNMEDIDKITNEQLKDILNNPNEQLEEISDVLMDVLYKLQKKIIKKQKNMIRNLDVATSNISLMNEIGKVVDELPDELKNQVKKNIEDKMNSNKSNNKKDVKINKDSKDKAQKKEDKSKPVSKEEINDKDSKVINISKSTTDAKKKEDTKSEKIVTKEEK
jgi:hypothetical protein